MKRYSPSAPFAVRMYLDDEGEYILYSDFQLAMANAAIAVKRLANEVEKLEEMNPEQAG